MLLAASLAESDKEEKADVKEAALLKRCFDELAKLSAEEQFAYIVYSTERISKVPRYECLIASSLSMQDRMGDSVFSVACDHGSVAMLQHAVSVINEHNSKVPEDVLLVQPDCSS